MADLLQSGQRNVDPDFLGVTQSSVNENIVAGYFNTKTG